MTSLFSSLSVFLLAATSVAQVALPPVYVSRLGADTLWYSDDTRTSAGAYLLGLVSTVPHPTSGTTGYTTTGDELIAQQIAFGDFYATSDNGVVRLDGTTTNSGKSSIKRYGLSVPASELAAFSSTFRWYMDPYTTNRTPALSLVVVGTNGLAYSLAYVGEGSAPGWNTFTVNAGTMPTVPASYGWRIYGNGAPGGTVPGTSLEGLLADPTWGAILSGGTVIAHGFNIGSSQRLCRVGIDWLESSILEGGARIDFVTNTDTDGDDLIDLHELQLGTDPALADTDADGLDDGVEVRDSETNPTDSDSDDDGLSDGQEVNVLGTDPLDTDTDNDSLNDFVEVTLLMTNPLVPNDGGAGAILADLSRDVADDMLAVPATTTNFDAPNANSAKGRQNSMASRINNAAKALETSDYESALELLASVHVQLDGLGKDWMKDTQYKTDLRTQLDALIAAVAYFQ